MSDQFVALLAGLGAGAALVLGAVLAWFFRIPERLIASVMAFGSGVLISALAFDLVLEAESQGGFIATVIGFAFGAIVYVFANIVLDRVAARRRRGSGDDPGTGLGIALGALLDGVPESAVLGLSVLGGQGVSVPVLIAIVISNLPEGLSSTAELRRSGRQAGYIFVLWGGIALASGLAAFLGYVLLQNASGEIIAVITATAAGAILAMICDTMIPQAFQKAHAFTGLIATVGFLLSFAVHQLAAG